MEKWRFGSPGGRRPPRLPSAPTESNLSPAGKSGRGRESQEMDAAEANK